MTLGQIVAHFRERGFRCKERGREVRCQCPAHEGEDLNLVLSVGDKGGVVAKCHSHGCTVFDIAPAVGLTVSDFAPHDWRANGQRPAAPEKEWPYRDEAGRTLFQVVRLANKQFRQRRPDANGGWIWGLGEVRRVLFGLPELLKTQPGDFIAIVEGEKDAVNVAQMGIAATTNPMGAGKWRQEHTDWLRQHLADRRFILLPDNDEPGRKHAMEVYESLKHAGLDIAVVDLPGLPDKGDVSDWIGKGGTGEALRDLLKPAPPKLWARLLSFAQLLEQPPPQWLIEGMFFEETMIEVFGEPNSGKSFVVIDEAIALRLGGEWCGRPINRPGPVLYVNADGGRGFSDRARAWVEIHGKVEAPHEFWTLPEAVNLCRQQDMAELMALIRYLPAPPVLVVFDTYSRCIPGVNENLQEFASQVVEHLDRLRLEFHASVKLVHHTDLSGAHARGSSVIIGACDTQARVEKSPDNIVSVTCEKQRDAPYFEPLHFQLGRVDGTNAVWITRRDEGPAEDRSDRKESGISRVLEAIRRDPGITREALSLGLDIHERSIRRYVETLILRSQVVETEVPGDWLHRPPRGLFAV